MRTLLIAVVALFGVVITTVTFAQGSPPQGGTMPMQGSMCGGPGGMCGMSPPAQATPMQGMTQSQQGGMTMSCCPMMQRAATIESRLRQLEERAGITSPPAQPSAPSHAH